MKKKIIVFYAKPYCVVDEKTGEINEGISVSYYGSDSFDPTSSDGAVGKRPSKASLPLELKEKLKIAPGVYEGVFEFEVDSKGKEFLKLQDLEFISEITVALKQSK